MPTRIKKWWSMPSAARSHRPWSPSTKDSCRIGSAKGPAVLAHGVESGRAIKRRTRDSSGAGSTSERATRIIFVDPNWLGNNEDSPLSVIYLHESRHWFFEGEIALSYNNPQTGYFEGFIMTVPVVF